MPLRKVRLWTVVTVSLALVAASCADDPQPDQVGPGTTLEPVRKGGNLTIGALQEPACADWYAACGNSSWGRDMMGSQTLPRAFDFFVEGGYRPSILLAGEPVLKPGPPQTVTYRINPQAVWSDGTLITSADFKYTAEQAKAASNSTAALAIDAVDASDPATVVVTFKDPTPAWRDNFNRLLPAHLLAGKDRTEELRNGYKFSAGPWAIDHWTKNVEIKLVPNPTYWGPKPNLDSVVFKIITDAAAYQSAYKTSQLDMAFFQGAQPEVAELKALPDTTFRSSVGFTYEFVLFNTTKAPLDSQAVRQALAHAADRQSIVTQQSGVLEPNIEPAQAFMSPGNKEWYSDPFTRYGRDLARVTQLMTQDGWARSADGVWAKAGNRASVELNAATGNRRREQAEQILQSQWKEAGFDVTVRNTTQAMLTGEWLPKGIFQAAIVSLSPLATDPNLCGTFCSKNIPTEANGYQGGNSSRISNKDLDDLWERVAKELDDAKRRDLVGKAQQMLSDQVPALPLSPVLDIVVYNSAKVGGLKTNPVGAFYNLSEWYCRSSC